jgi:hypothetical protein
MKDRRPLFLFSLKFKSNSISCDNFFARPDSSLGLVDAPTSEEGRSGSTSFDPPPSHGGAANQRPTPAVRRQTSCVPACKAVRVQLLSERAPQGREQGVLRVPRGRSPPDSLCTRRVPCGALRAQAVRPAGPPVSLRPALCLPLPGQASQASACPDCPETGRPAATAQKVQCPGAAKPTQGAQRLHS